MLGGRILPPAGDWGRPRSDGCVSTPTSRELPAWVASLSSRIRRQPSANRDRAEQSCRALPGDGQAKMREYYYRAALRMKRRLGRSHPDLAVTTNNLALLSICRAGSVRAHSWMGRALPILESILGVSHPSTIWRAAELPANQQSMPCRLQVTVGFEGLPSAPLTIPLSGKVGIDGDRPQCRSGKLESIMIRLRRRLGFWPFSV